jgi:predicted DNA-binding protein
MDLTSDQASPSEFFDVSAQERRRRTRLVSVRLPEELVLRLAVVGNGEGMTMSETIRRVLERGLGQVKPTKAARKKKKKE